MKKVTIVLVAVLTVLMVGSVSATSLWQRVGGMLVTYNGQAPVWVSLDDQAGNIWVDYTKCKASIAQAARLVSLSATMKGDNTWPSYPFSTVDTAVKKNVMADCLPAN